MELKIEVMFYVYNKEFNKRIEKHYTTVDRLCDGRDDFKYNEVDVIAKRLFTGEVDKSGSEIYNGDITNHENVGLCKIIYDKTEFLLISLKNNQRVCLRGKFNDVIGNIYENPELLEVVK